MYTPEVEYMRRVLVTASLMVILLAPLNPLFSSQFSINKMGKDDLGISELPSELLTGNGEWERTFGRSDEFDYFYYVDVTSDGGFIIAGSTLSYSRFDDYLDMWLVKTDSLGNEEWNKTFSVWGDEYQGMCAHQTRDGGYILVGYARFSGKIVLIKTDENGDLIWKKTFDGYKGSYVEETSDNGYIIAGTTEDHDVYLIKTDSNGNMVWNRTYGGDDLDRGYCVHETSEGGFIVTGLTFSYGHYGHGDVWLIKTDSLGNELWNKTFYAEEGPNVGYCVRETSDGGFIIAGETSMDFGQKDVYLIKTDCYGGLEWSRTFGGGGFDWARYVEETSDGGFILVGGTGSYSRYGGNDLWLIKTDRFGNKVLGRILGSSDSDRGYCVHEIGDNGFIVAGVKNFCSSSGAEGWLVKVVADNKPPSKPVVTGPSTAKINKPYTINITSVDPEGDSIYYFVVVWGIGVSGWIGPYKSGETVSFTFTCSNEGVYNITVKAMDEHGWESVMSDPLRVTFPKPYWLNLLPPFIQRILLSKI